MKTFEESMRILNAYRAEQNETKKLTEELEHKQTTFFHSKPLTFWKDNPAAHAELDEIRDRLNEVYDRMEEINLRIKFASANAKTALWNETAPKIAAVWNKYAGKQYGEKTRAKIRNEMKEQTGADVYIGYYYSYPHINVNMNGIYIEATDYSDDKILRDNKIFPLDPAALTIYDRMEYIDDIPAHVEKLRAKFDEARKAEEEFLKLCAEYNEMISGDMNRIDTAHKVWRIA